MNVTTSREISVWDPAVRLFHWSLAGAFLVAYGTTDFAGPLAGVWRGETAADILEEVHEIGANLTLLLVVLHVAGVLFSSLEHGENLIKSMVTGRKKEIKA